MCGRITLSANLTEILARFELAKTAPDLDFRPLYNGAPGQNVPVVLSESPDTLSSARWGLLPHWAKDEKIGYKLINARAEGIAEKPSYRDAWKKGRRCLVIVDGFFEWKAARSGKEPFCIDVSDQRPFALAGLYETYEKGPKPVTTFTIITTAPNAFMKKIHDRMPVILPKAREKNWLKTELAPEKALDFLQAYSAEKMRAYRVSTLVNNPRNNLPEILTPLPVSKGQTTL